MEKRNMSRKSDANHVKISTEKPLCLHFNVKEAQEKKVMRISLDSCKSNVRPEIYERKGALPTKPKVVSNSKATCLNCSKLKEELVFKDKVIQELSDDRDVVKARLTEVQNKNVELELMLQKFQKHSCKSTKKVNGCQKKADLDGQHAIDFHVMKEKCNELEEINKHLQEHLINIRKAFNDAQCHSNYAGSVRSKGSSRGISRTKEKLEKLDKLSEGSNDIASQASTGNESDFGFEDWYEKQ